MTLTPRVPVEAATRPPPAPAPADLPATWREALRADLRAGLLAPDDLAPGERAEAEAWLAGEG